MKLLVSVIVAAGLGLGIGLRLYTHFYENYFALRFEQPEIDLRASPAIEGDTIEVVAHLHNFGKLPLRIIQKTTN